MTLGYFEYLYRSSQIDQHVNNKQTYYQFGLVKLTNVSNLVPQSFFFLFLVFPSFSFFFSVLSFFLLLAYLFLSFLIYSVNVQSTKISAVDLLSYFESKLPIHVSPHILSFDLTCVSNSRLTYLKLLSTYSP